MSYYFPNSAKIVTACTTDPDACTILLSIRRITSASLGRIFAKSQNSGTGENLHLRFNGAGDITFESGNTRTFPTLSLSTDYQIAFHFDRSQSPSLCRAWYNGTEQTQTGTSGAQFNSATTGKWIIGNREDGGRAAESNIWEFAIYDRLLDAAEIAQHAAGFTPRHISRGRIFYAPLIASAQDLVSGNSGTVTTATVATHGRVYP